MMCPACAAVYPVDTDTCPSCDLRLSPRAMAVGRPPLPLIPYGARGHLPGPLGRRAPQPAGTLLNGRYRVLRLLGSGSFGRVYLAEDCHDSLRAPVAIKELLDDQFGGPERTEAMAWFQREVSTLLGLRHPAIPTVQSFWSALPGRGPLYLAMDYIPGPTLETVLGQAQGGLPWRTVSGWGLALCQVLEYLHNQQPPLIYRDLKLSNVILDERNGAPTLIDFGIARRFSSPGGTMIGTWGYVPFEQALGRAEPRSDLYALGALLHALLTGRHPDVEFSKLQAGGQDLQGAIRRLFPPVDTLAPHMPRALAEIITRATAFSPWERFVDARSMAAALSAVLEPTTVRLHAESAGQLAPHSRTVPCLTVCAGGSGTFQTIMAAVRRAPAGARILVQPGCYAERVVIDRPLEIIGSGPLESIIVEAQDGPALQMRASEATVRGLTLRGRPGLGHKRIHVVEISRGRLLLEECRISGSAGACVSIHGQDTAPVIRRCTILAGQQGGLLFHGAAQGAVEECEISGNTVGVMIRRFASPVVRGCTVHNAVSFGIHADDYAEGTIEACRIDGSGQAGICIDRGSTLTVRRCAIYGNERAVVVAPTAGGHVEGCELTGNRLGPWSVAPDATAWLQRYRNQE